MHIPFGGIRNPRISLLLGCIGIILVFLLPIPVAEVTHEENPQDGAAKMVYADHGLIFAIPDAPPHMSGIALWMGDTLRAPKDTPLTISIGHTELATSLHAVFSGNRKITIPISPSLPQEPITIQISANSLNEKNSIRIRTQQSNAEVPAYTLYVRKPVWKALLGKLYSQQAVANDIEYVWREGTAILNNRNPYATAATVRDGDKYPSYLPLSYIVSATIQKMGFSSFESWLVIARPIILVSQVLSACFVLFYLYKKGKLLLGILGFFLIIFHRFTLYPARVTHIDFPAISLLLLGMMLLSKRPKLGYLAISASLAIKHIAVFLIPLLLIYEWHRTRSMKSILLACMFILIVPVITLSSFIIDSPIGTTRSILFSLSRTATGDFASPDITGMLSLEGFSARIPLFGMMLLVYITALRKEIAIYGASLAVFAIFIGFNPVLFFQYLAWIIPFIPLALAEYQKR
jgi:hypothetical protein